MNVTRGTRLILNIALLFYKYKCWKDNNTMTIPLKKGSMLMITPSSCSIYVRGKDDDEKTVIPSNLLARLSNKRDSETSFIPSPFNKKQYILMGDDKLEIPENITMKEPNKDEFLRVIDILENYEFSASIMIDDSLIRTIQLFLEFNAGFILRMFYFTFSNEFKTMDEDIIEDLERIIVMELGDAAY